MGVGYSVRKGDAGMSSRENEAAEIINRDDDKTAHHNRRMSESSIVISRKDHLPETAKWHMQHKPYGNIGKYKQPCDIRKGARDGSGK